MPAQLFGWIADFFHERRIRVVFDSCVLKFMTVNDRRTTGIGAIPTPFLLHINDSTIHRDDHGPYAGRFETEKERSDLIIS